MVQLIQGNARICSVQHDAAVREGIINLNALSLKETTLGIMFDEESAGFAGFVVHHHLIKQPTSILKDLVLLIRRQTEHHRPVLKRLDSSDPQINHLLAMEPLVIPGR